uniref:DNA 3'-5' helicase n=1 Tax=Spongospora subterranea TaxID=70186 RepID=A0A0H5RAQ4_9EUKA|eukprot:CRZ10732.1 hypothetical protein [Spongospora subterranea]
MDGNHGDNDGHFDHIKDQQRNNVQNIVLSRDFSSMDLKTDHVNRPVWVMPNGKVLLETFSPIYKQAYDFLIGIAEPVTRPYFIHEYQITNLSLYAAASVGLRTSDILSGLRRLCKTDLPSELIEFIETRTERCGKVRLVLNKNRYFVESIYAAALQNLLRVPIISQARIDQFDSSLKERDPVTGFITSLPAEKESLHLPGTDANTRIDQSKAMGMDLSPTFDANISSANPTAVLSFEIDPKTVEDVRRECIQIEYPMLEEYEFRKDDLTPNLPISLKPIAQIRSYQEKSLSKMFGNGRARSGIIVLPCGAGKTLVGITATCTVRKSTLVFCNTGVSVDQWKRQYLHWANIPRKNVSVFTSTTKDAIVEDEAALVITTYNMIAFSGQRSAAAQKILEQIRKREWGLVILDEVHVAPARTFRLCVSMTHSRCKLGLTATLLREDDLIDHLSFLIGPKLYEANWLALQLQGYLATVQCVEVRCPMTAEFYAEYLTAEAHKQRLLYVMNPNKFRACQYLINWHEARGDKILVFSDNIFSLEKYAKDLKRPLIHGKTKDQERLDFLKHIQTDDNLNTLFISKVGDTSIDLPDVNVIIQISSHFASRRQEAQRLGRILRPKATTSSRFNAYFYTLVSEDTKEMLYATKRQTFLIDQGYSFKVVTNLVDTASHQGEKLLLNSKNSQLELLSQVMASDRSSGDLEDVADQDGDMCFSEFRQEQIVARRKKGQLSTLTGAHAASYDEVVRRPPAVSKLAEMRKKERTEAKRRRMADDKRRQEMEELKADEGGVR